MYIFLHFWLSKTAKNVQNKAKPQPRMHTGPLNAQFETEPSCPFSLDGVVKECDAN